jgi:transcriptional regulator with XRE-family HTH domain
VSKWEIEDSFPSIEFFPLLAKLFDVSIDYLMTGKIENVNLDDMDATKRIHYLIENDDLDNFKKYDCIRIAIPTRNYSPSLDESIWKAILKADAGSIFSFCCDEFLSALPKIVQHHQNCSTQDAFGYYIRK